MKIKEIKIREDDGSYSDAIPVGVDFINVDTTNGSNLKIDLDNINKDLDNKTNQIDNLKNKDISLQNQINSLASGSPLVANSVEEMTDITRVYVNTSDGHWYWYNGTEWTVGGVYQASQIPEFSIGNSKLIHKNITIENLDLYKDLLYLAYEVRKNQKVVGYNTTTFLPDYRTDKNFNSYVFNMSDLLNLRTYKNKYGYNNSKTYQSIVMYTENSKAWNAISTGITDSNNFVSINDGFEKFVLCLPKESLYFKTFGEYTHSGDIINDIAENIEIKNKNVKNIYGSKVDLRKTDLTQFEGVEILKNRSLSGYNTSTYEIQTNYKENYTTVIVDKTIFTKFANLRDIRIKISDEYDINTNVIVGVNKTKSQGFNFIKNTLMNDSNFKHAYNSDEQIYNFGTFISGDIYYMNNFEKIAFGFYSQELEFYTEEINDLNPNKAFLESDYLICGVNAFNSIGAIGDSYTAASVKHSDGSWTDQTNQSYIATIGRRAGVEWANYGVGGSNTRTYLTASNGLAKVLADTPKDFYMLALGINDTALGVNDYLGSIHDIKEDYTQNNDSFYGNYAKIIEQVKAHSPKAKFIMVKIPILGENYSIFSNAIQKIADHYGIPTINPFDDNFFSSSLYNTKIDGHPTCPGYVGMGLAYERLISKCISVNVNYFKFSTVG